MYAFEYHRPTTLSEAAALLSQKPDAKLLAGGHTLLPTMKQRLAQPSDLIDLSQIQELKGISEEGGALVIGAMTRHGEVERSELVRRTIPALADLAGRIGDPQVRNRGTIGGSLANNDPAADWPAAVLGLGARIRTNRREIAADDFFTGMFETALGEDEIITQVVFPKPQQAAYAKFPNPASRYAIVGVFVARTDQGIRVAVTGAGPCVFRAGEIEAALARDFSPQAVDGVEIDPADLNSDIHASADYRAHLVKVMTKRALAQLA